MRGNNPLGNLSTIGPLLADILETKRDLKLIIVPGGGNIARGEQFVGESHRRRYAADYIGMMATNVNAMALVEAGALRSEHLGWAFLTSFAPPYPEALYHVAKARDLLSRNRVLVLGGGTGNVGVTTDTAAVMRARELGADLVVKATPGVDGVLSQGEPKILISRMSYSRFLSEGFDKILDREAVVAAQRAKLPVRVFRSSEENLRAVLSNDQSLGTLITD